MTLKELLKKTLSKGLYDKYTLLIQHYGICGEYSLEREYYTDTPIFDKFSSLSEDELNNYIVLIPFYLPMDIGRVWTYWDLQTIVVTTREELLKHYSEPQLSKWLEWLDNEVRKEVLRKTL